MYLSFESSEASSMALSIGEFFFLGRASSSIGENLSSKACRKLLLQSVSPFPYIAFFFLPFLLAAAAEAAASSAASRLFSAAASARSAAFSALSAAADASPPGGGSTHVQAQPFLLRISQERWLLPAQTQLAEVSVSTVQSYFLQDPGVSSPLSGGERRRGSGGGERRRGSGLGRGSGLSGSSCSWGSGSGKALPDLHCFSFSSHSSRENTFLKTALV